MEILNEMQYGILLQTKKSIILHQHSNKISSQQVFINRTILLLLLISYWCLLVKLLSMLEPSNSF